MLFLASRAVPFLQPAPPPKPQGQRKQLLPKSPAGLQIEIEIDLGNPHRPQTQQTKQNSLRAVVLEGLGVPKIDFDFDFELLAEIGSLFPLCLWGRTGKLIN